MKGIALHSMERQGRVRQKRRKQGRVGDEKGREGTRKGDRKK